MIPAAATAAPYDAATIANEMDVAGRASECRSGDGIMIDNGTVTAARSADQSINHLPQRCSKASFGEGWR